MADFDKRDFDILVAKCGKSIGLKGEIRLIIYSDFDEIWQQGNVFLCKSDFARDSRDLALDSALDSRDLVLDSQDLMRDSALDSRDSRSKLGESHESNAFFLTLKSFNPHKNSAFFDGINSVECAKNLTSMLLYSSEFLTQKYCTLSENEHFWFEVVGMSVVDNGEIMGAVSDIERIGSVDYLLVATNPAILAKYPHIKAKQFYIPYIPRYIVRIDKTPQSQADKCANGAKGSIFVRDSLGILEES